MFSLDIRLKYSFSISSVSQCAKVFKLRIRKSKEDDDNDERANNKRRKKKFLRN